jgi:hypothetical protein
MAIKRATTFAIIAALPIMTAGLAAAQEMNTIKAATVGCFDKEVAARLWGFIAENDQDAFAEFYNAAMMAGACKTFKAGEKVFLEDTSFFQGLVCVRPKGSLSCLWLSFGMIE